MTALLNVLILEDNKSDADLLCRELKKSGLNFMIEIVQTRLEFEHSLVHFNPDLILSDYALPSFDAVTAFRIKQQKHSHIPFIIVSGIIGEENVVELIKDGVTDYVSKQKLFTLFNKIKRALNDTEVRNEKVSIAEKLRVQTEELIAANKELIVQNLEKEKRTADLIILSNNLKLQQIELQNANNKLLRQEEEVNHINSELSALNQELELRVAKRTKALAESENLFRTMMETIPQIAWTNSVEGEIIFCNQRWYDYTGLMDWNFFTSVIHREDRKECFVQYYEILKKTDGGEFQIRAKHKDGSYRWHLIRLMPILDQVNQVQLWVGTATDIQELKLLQQQKDDFISIASHELKTPITTLKASLQLLDRIKEKPMSKMLPILIDQANKNLKRVSTLVEDLLDVSLANKGQLHVNQERFNIYQSINDSCNDVHLEDNYVISIVGDEDIEVFADSIRIEQVVVNFITNAVKYAPQSTDIVISIKRIEDIVKIAVIDKGPGIPSDKLPHLFDRYYQVDHKNSSYTGLGLGLYICSEIIQKHHGEIGVDSIIGNGSTFWFSLPIAQ